MHPIVRMHEETGRTSLYANPYSHPRIQGLGDAESEALIAELTDHMVGDARRSTATSGRSATS